MQTTDPWIKNFRANTRINMILLPFLIAIQIFEAVLNLFSHHPITFITIFILVIALFEIFAYLLFLSRRRVWKYHEQTRLRALSGDPTLLAPSQPASIAPITQPITFPLVIEARQKIGLFLFVLTLFVGALLFISAIIFFAILFATTPTQPSSPSNTLPIFITNSTFIISALVCLAFIFIVLVIVAIVFRRTTIHRIEATEQGITVTYQGITRPLTWDSLRFFSVSPSTRSNRLLYYELSSDHNYLNWFIIQSPSLTRSSYYRPTVPFDQYQHDTQTLLALIQQRTNLPLYQLPPFNTLFPPKKSPPR